MCSGQFLPFLSSILDKRVSNCIKTNMWFKARYGQVSCDSVLEYIIVMSYVIIIG